MLLQQRKSSFFDWILSYRAIKNAQSSRSDSVLCLRRTSSLGSVDASRKKFFICKKSKKDIRISNQLQNRRCLYDERTGKHFKAGMLYHPLLYAGAAYNSAPLSSSLCVLRKCRLGGNHERDSVGYRLPFDSGHASVLIRSVFCCLRRCLRCSSGRKYDPGQRPISPKLSDGEAGNDAPGS